MSKFLVHLWNHTKEGIRSLEDVVGIWGHQLRALGHEVVWDPDNTILNGKVQFVTGEDTYNVIVEGFTPTIVDIIGKAKETTGAKFICLATEEPTEKGFNHGTQKEMVWRQETFGPAMDHFEGILHLVPGKAVSDWYSQYLPTAYVELGYAPTFIRGERYPEPPFDVGFYGSVTPRRLHLLKRLAKRIGTPRAVRLMADFQEQEKRDAVVQEAKIIVQIRKFDEMGLVSSSRCNTALSCGRPVVAEAHDEALSKPWDTIVKFSRNEEDFINNVLLALPRWRALHRHQFERFRTMLTPEVCTGHALHKIGITEHPEGYAKDFRKAA